MTVITKIRLAALILALAALAGLWHLAGRALAERDELAAELTRSRAERAALTKELTLGYQALSKREAEKERLADENSRLTRELNSIYTGDPAARAWADTVCPVNVLDRLRD